MSTVTVSAEHMEGCENVVADTESRVIFWFWMDVGPSCSWEGLPVIDFA